MSLKSFATNIKLTIILNTLYIITLSLKSTNMEKFEKFSISYLAKLDGMN